MKHEQSFNTIDNDVPEWAKCKRLCILRASTMFPMDESSPRKTIRKHLTDIDTDSRLTADDKTRLKRFYFENLLPPSIQDVVRKYFPKDFRVNEYFSRSEGRAYGGDLSRGETWPSPIEREIESEGNRVIIQGDDDQ